jgi:phosphatidylserine/phosphatidylglycerophosphate/cardiolipin synthase-like enzyme
MNRPHQVIVEQAQRIAGELPLPLVETLAEAIEQAGSDWRKARGTILGRLSHAAYRSLATDLLRAWETDAPSVRAEAVALALIAAAEVERRHRQDQTVELVWTGPDTQAVPIRHTEQAVLQIINAATERLLVVSYAVYKIPRICEAMVRAADRGVRLKVVVEAGDRQGSHSIRSKLAALGEPVAQRAEVYYWPAEQRPRNDAEGQGVLHVKAAVADGRCMLLTSANLTEHAFTLNMEMGLLVTGGSLPAQTERHFEWLIGAGVLRMP